jgi:hypothetical protein
MRSECIPLEAAEQWSDALQGIPHAFGHTWDSCYAMSLSHGSNTYLFVFEEEGTRVICPLSERQIDGAVDIYTPYGFSGFVGNAPCPSFPDHWRRFAEQRGYVSGYIGLNPLLNDASLYDTSTLYSHNWIYMLDLQQPLEQLFARMKMDRQRRIRAAENRITLVTDHERLLDFLLEHYMEFYREKGASSVYRFDPETIVRLASGPHAILIGTEGPAGVDAVMLFTFTPYVAEYFLNVSIPDGQKNSVALLWRGIRELKSHKIPWLNLGGGIRPGDGVAQFKERFGGYTFSLKSLKQVYKAEQYENLCLKKQVNPDDKSGFFPPYLAS